MGCHADDAINSLVHYGDVVPDEDLLQNPQSLVCNCPVTRNFFAFVVFDFFLFDAFLRVRRATESAHKQYVIRTWEFTFGG